MEFTQPTITKAFTPAWWGDFLIETDNQTRTAVLNDCLEETETALFREYVLEILRTLARLRTNKHGFRIYIDGVKLIGNDMAQFYDYPPEAGETLEEWSTRVFGDKKFGMIVNLGEKLNVDLANEVAKKIRPLFQQVGFPREGVNFTIFIGNYDKTPLGIHQDPAGQSVTHFHLGPSDKTMYTWGKHEFPKLLEDKGLLITDVEELIPYATKYTFSEGDVYFMPEGEYHIGKQDGLSIAVTIWQYNLTKSKLLKKVVSTLIEQFAEEDNSLNLPDQNPLDSYTGIESTIDLLSLPPDMMGLSLPDLLREAYIEMRYAIQSNSGYRTSPLTADEIHLFENDDIIELVQPFQLLYKRSKDEERLQMFIRGVKIEFMYFQCITHLIDVINDGKPHKVEDLLDVLDETWETSTGKYLLGLFYKHHGIYLKVAARAALAAS